jgi:long-chain acyl-CoA synthetase
MSDQAGKPRTVARLWDDAVAAGHAAPPYRRETPTGWEPVTWAEADTAVSELAHGLLDLGIGRGDRVAILCSTRVEWSLLDFALAAIGATTIPIYPTSSAREVAYVLSHARVVAAIAETPAHLASVEAHRDELPALAHVVRVDELDALRSRGRDHAARNPHAVAAASATVSEDDLYTVIYTSGTTGPPKGCAITHRNYYAMTSTIDDLEVVLMPGDEMLLYLPLAHTFGRLMHLAGPYVGFTLSFCADPARLLDAVAAVRPTVLPSVPRLFEKVHAGVNEKLAAATGLQRAIGQWGLKVGLRAGALRLAGEPLPPALALQHRIADRLVHAKVRDRLGGRLRICLSGGAPLSPEVGTFLHAFGITILEGYGLTEGTAACSVNLPSAYRFGTVGKALPGFDMRLDEDGELLVRSDTVFAGYLDDPESTAAALTEDGWLRTGDVATIDADGFITITDRKKDIIVTAGGKNVAPQNVENELKAQPLFSQAIVIGDRRPYLVALLTLDEAVAAKAAAAADGGVRTGGTAPAPAPAPADLAGSPAVRALAEAAVARVNEGLARHEQVKRFALLPRDFTQEGGELTPTLKVRRRHCQELYAAEIDALYDGH